MDQTELARLEHQNYIGSMSAVCANASGGLVDRSNGVATILTGLPLRLFNQLMVEADDADDDALARAVGVARDRRDRFVVNLRDGIDDARRPLLNALGLRPMSPTPWIPGMALHPIPATVRPTSATDLEIRRVTDDRGVDDHIRTGAAGFELPEQLIRAVMNTASANEANTAVYVGYVDGAPVTTGLGFRTGRTIGVYNISTLPASRGRGYGALMTQRVAADGAGAGCDVAVLQASDMGLPIYERLGYRTVVQYRGYIDPD